MIGLGSDKKLIRLETVKRMRFQGGSKYRDIDDDGNKNDGVGLQSIRIVIMIITKEKHSRYENSDYNRKKRIALKV